MRAAPYFSYSNDAPYDKSYVLFVTVEIMNRPRIPREIALSLHHDYYVAGGYAVDRLNWTLDTFLQSSNLGKVLEVGCGDGAMLQILANRKIEVVGVDASSSGIDRCLVAGLRAQCLDVSTDALPFPDDSFDVVICLETFEHLMNPHFALQEIRRTLRSGGIFLCSIPNPRTGHPYLYPGLFEYKNFRCFLEQSGFSIERVQPWQWAPRETILPLCLRHIPILNGRIIAGGFRRLAEKSCRIVSIFPYFCYWLWTFDCLNQKDRPVDIYASTAVRTRPGSEPGSPLGTPNHSANAL
jgi:SAM-dependent methyltransferase